MARPPTARNPGQAIPHGAGDEAADTRKTLMEMLKRAGESDVATLAEQIGISGVAIRHHLGALERDGLVAQRSVRRPVGRPARLYRLTVAAEKEFPQSSDRVALELLARLEEMMGGPALEELFMARLKDLDGRYRARLRGARSWARRLEILAEIRDSEGYLCNVEPSGSEPVRGGVRLVEHHCPLADLARQHPQVCAYELELFKRVLDEPDLERCEHILSGGHACTYIAHKRTR